ncbi:MAG: hypothetical protein KBB50_04090, partial [Candidatus Pacebacteria bacterium]|nr:hypothetical protein [Candidatus Paceibacterota bacterium]
MKFTNKLFTKLAAGVIISGLGLMNVYAASLSSLSDTLSSAKINTVSNHSFSFVTPTGVASGAIIVITFPTDFSIPVGLTYADVDINSGATPTTASSTLAAAPVGATVGVVRTSSTVLTITNGTTVIAPGTTVYVRIGTNAIHQSTGTFQITNATTNGSKA